MKRNSQLLGAALALAVCAGTAHAAPENGFSVNGGLVASGTAVTITGGVFKGVAYSYSGSGLSLGVDYQFALGQHFSLNPFLMSSGEAISGLGNSVSGGHGIVGLQGRFWFGSGGFIGAHIGSYSETVTFNKYNISTNASGPGGGLVAGWENPAGGIYVLGQVDSAKLNYVNTDTKYADVRLSVGYRWK
jgi:hypothetical protein